MDDDGFDVLLTSDLARDVRETFEEMIGFGATPVAATQEAVSRFGTLLNDDADGPVVIVALVVMQLRHGVIFSSIRDAAAAAIDGGAARRLASGPDPSARKALARLRELLDEIPTADDEDEDSDDSDDA